jgi:glucose 1-dehydrogenase
MDTSPNPMKAAFGLADQVAIVTGASSGLGKACAEALGAAGCKVVINCLSSCKDDADKVAKTIEDSGSEATVIAADVSSESDVEAMFAETIKRFGTVHILVNNAGIPAGARFTEMTLDQWQKVLSVDLNGQFLCARSAIREFLRRGPQPDVSSATCKIICMSSVHQRIPWAFEANYSAAKGGVMLLMQSLAQEFAPKQVRVNAIAPGAIQTEINHEAWATPEAMSSLLKLIPYGRIGEPPDIGKAAVFLASDLSDYMSGTTVFVDGGMALYPGFRGGG